MNTVTAQDIIKRLRGETRREVIWLEELRLGTGYGGTRERRIDLMELHGGAVGGMTCCKTCHDKHYASSPERTNEHG